MSTESTTPEPRKLVNRCRAPLRGWGLESMAYHVSFLLFALALLWRPLFAGEAFFWGTPLLQFVPWQRLAADMWRSGRLPLWNPLVGCGAPLAANYQTGAFYPLNALHLLMRTEVALSWTVALHLALTGWGMYRWGHSIGLDRFPAFVGGLALQGSGFLVARAGLFPSIALTFPWLSIWLWRGEILIQRMRRRDAVWLGVTLGLGLLAGHAQTAFYGGLLLGAYVLFRTLQGSSRGLPVRGCTLEASGRRLQVAGLLLVSLVVGLGLAAVQLLPTAELLMHSQRSTGVLDGLAMTYSLWPWRLITFAAPDFFGNPGRGTYWGYATYWEDAGYVGVLPLLLASWAVMRAISGMRRASKARRVESQELKTAGCASEVKGWGLKVDHWPFWESLSGRYLIIFWAGVGVVGVVLALGKNTPLFPFLFTHVPGFDLFQAPARWLGITTMALAALAGIGAQRWPCGRRGQQLGGLAATVGGALLIGGLTAPRLRPNIPFTFEHATARLGGMLIFAGSLTLLRGRTQGDRTRGPTWWRVAVGAFIILDLVTFGWPLMPTVDRSLYRGETRTDAALRAEGGNVRVYWPADPDHQNRDYDAHYRVKFDYLRFDDFGPGDADYWRDLRKVQLPNAGMLDDLASANNFDPLLVGRYSDVVEAGIDAPSVLKVMGVTHVVTDRPWPGGSEVHSSEAATFYRLPDPTGRAWIVPRARRVAAAGTLEALTDPSFDPKAEVLLEVEPPVKSDSRPAAGTSSIQSLQDGPNAATIRVSLEAPGYLVLADTWFPGWGARVDDERAELLRANHAFRAVALDAGEHVIEMTYRPISVVIGGSVSLIAAASVILCLMIDNKRALNH